MNVRPTFVSLFAGIGGFDLGLERAGWECVAQVENNEFCQGILEKHWPDVPRYADIRDCRGSDLPPVEMVVGGFPCQPFSSAGQRRGTDDDRFLWPEMLRVVDECQPTWVIGENVPGLFGLYLDQCIADLEGQGYEVWPVVLPACAVGAPHLRERIFIVAYSSSRATQLQRRPKWVSRQAGEAEGQGDQRQRSGDATWRSGTTGSLAHGYDVGRKSVWSSRILDGERAAQRDDADGRSSWNPRPGAQQSFVDEPPRELLYWGGAAGATGWAKPTDPGFWDGVEPVLCHDGKTRPTKPGLRLLADGVPDRVARLRALGNAVVPQVAEFLGRLIIDSSDNVTQQENT